MKVGSVPQKLQSLVVIPQFPKCYGIHCNCITPSPIASCLALIQKCGVIFDFSLWFYQSSALYWNWSYTFSSNIYWLAFRESRPSPLFGHCLFFMISSWFEINTVSWLLPITKFACHYEVHSQSLLHCSFLLLTLKKYFWISPQGFFLLLNHSRFFIIKWPILIVLKKQRFPFRGS